MRQANRRTMDVFSVAVHFSLKFVIFFAICILQMVPSAPQSQSAHWPNCRGPLPCSGAVEEQRTVGAVAHLLERDSLVQVGCCLA
jgi:hypothetical protein